MPDGIFDKFVKRDDFKKEFLEKYLYIDLRGEEQSKNDAHLK